MLPAVTRVFITFGKKKYTISLYENYMKYLDKKREEKYFSPSLH